MIKKIGIECHNLEGPRFGVGQTLIQFLEALSQTPGIAEKFEFHLYFKKEIPSDKVLTSHIFHKKILRVPLLPPSFTFFYHFLIPLIYFTDSLDGFFFPGYMLPAFFIGRSAVVLTNDLYYEIHNGNLPLRYRLAYRIFSWWAIKKTDKIITISETAKKELSQLFKIPNEKIEVAPWGLNQELARLSFRDDEIDNIKKKYSIKKDLIFSWGQAFPRRHFQEAILAFAKIAKDFPDLQYLVACADKYNPPVLADLARKINAELGREAIIYRSYIEDQKELFGLVKTARLVIYASESEAMGLPPIEALSLKTPAVVADNDLTHEIFDRYAFFIKNPANVEETAETIKNGILNETKRREIINNGPAIVKKFSWPISSKKILEIFDKIF
ncbi:MAG: glycosyltransferase family 1 protein [bacterium]|nr:glycosyltransferase family 1 protein [bacterium]